MGATQQDPVNNRRPLVHSNINAIYVDTIKEYDMDPKYIRTLSSDVLKLTTCLWKEYFPFPVYLVKMTILLAVGNCGRQVGKCGDVQSPHCLVMISRKNHTWVQ